MVSNCALFPIPHFIFKGSLVDPLLRATFSPAYPLANIFHPPEPSDCFAIDFPRRAINPGEGLPISYASLGGSGRSCPLLRASNEHCITVRVLRARRAPGRCLPIPSQGARSGSTGSTGVSFHPLIVRVPRAGGRPGHPPSAGGLFRHPARGGEMGRVGQREQRDRHRQRQRSQSLLSFNYPALTAFFRALNNCSWLIGFGRNSTPAALNMLEAFSSFGDPLSTMIGQVGYWER